MTESEAQLRRAIGVVEVAFPSGNGGWSKRKFELWVDGLRDIEPAAVEVAAFDLVRSWADDRGRAPQLGHLRERALMVQRKYRENLHRPSWDPYQGNGSNLDEVIPNMPPWIAEIMERTRERVRSGLQ